MAVRYHISRNGETNVCTAKTTESCRAISPNGEKSEHFENYNEAVKNSEKLLNNKYSITKSLQKSSHEPKIIKNNKIPKFIHFQGIKIQDREKTLMFNTMKPKQKNFDNFKKNMYNGSIKTNDTKILSMFKM